MKGKEANLRSMHVDMSILTAHESHHTLTENSELEHQTTKMQQEVVCHTSNTSNSSMASK